MIKRGQDCQEGAKEVRERKDVLDQCPIDIFMKSCRVLMLKSKKPKEQVEQEQDVDRINE